MNPQNRQSIRSQKLFPIIFVQRFLIITAILFTLLIVVIDVLILFDKMNHYLLQNDKWFTFGYFIGAWFGFMVGLSAVFMLSEIALAIRDKD